MVKIAFVDFWKGFNKEGFILTQALRVNYQVEIVEKAQEADYVFYSIFGDEHWFLPDRIVKIFYTGENLCPDFNDCDYAVGFEWMDYGDRYLRLPNYYCTPLFAAGFQQMEKVKSDRKWVEDPAILNRKFCSFVVSNADANPIRQHFFEKLSKYKQVDSGGRFMNNVGGPVADKIAFHQDHKFVISFENSSHSGYTTEKIVDAFAAKCIPIYWGDPDISRVFNPKSFVPVKSVEEAIEEIKRLDTDHEAYLSMLREQPLISDDYSYKKQFAKVVEFLDNILDQPIEKAHRRNREFWGKKYLLREQRLVANGNMERKQLLKKLLGVDTFFRKKTKL